MPILELIAAFMLAGHSGNAGGEKANEYVDVRLNLAAVRVKAGDSTSVLISFKPRQGVHITGDPKLVVVFDTLKQFFAARSASFDTVAKGYVDTQKPVRQHFTVAPSTPPGSYPLRGTMTYYYCSDDERWCSRFRQPFALTLTVGK